MYKKITLVLLITSQLVSALHPVHNRKTLSLAQLATDDFGSNILNLLSIHAALGDPMEDLNNSLEEIRGHVNDEEEWDANTWHIEEAELQSTIETNQNCYDEAVANVENFQTQLSSANERFDNLNRQIEEYMVEKEGLKTRMDNHLLMVEQEVDAYDVRQADDTQAVNACNDAIRLLQGFPPAGASLIQVQELRDVTLKISTRAMKEGSAFLPLIGALTTLVEMETVNPSACAEVITLLENLRDAIASAQVTDQVNHGVNVAMWDQTWGDMETQLSTLVTNIEDQETKRTNTVSVIEGTTEVLALEEVTRDNCNRIVNLTTSTLNTKTSDFERRHRVRMAQLDVLDKLQEFVAENLQAAYDEMNSLF